ncbi:MAG TPA: HPr family phosphocarrier protein [Anaerolineales bacterium]|nr:HPr family phosphocarrier protein [Anaerolineales bacterium]
MQNITLNVINEVGLHARPASEFVKMASQFRSKILVRNVTRDTASVDAKSILSVLALGVEKGHEIELAGDGEDEEQAIKSLRELIESDFAGKF